MIDRMTESRMALIPELDEFIRNDERKRIASEVEEVFRLVPNDNDGDRFLEIVMDPIFVAIGAKYEENGS